MQHWYKQVFFFFSITLTKIFLVSLFLLKILMDMSEQSEGIIINFQVINKHKHTHTRRGGGGRGLSGFVCVFECVFVCVCAEPFNCRHIR